MDKKVILAVAGAGKTYTLCHNLNLNERNLILAFTNQNIFNIKRELIDAYGEIPVNTKVMTFHSFVYQFFIAPYEPTIIKYFGIMNFQKDGITIRKPPEPNFFKNRKRIPNKAYHTKDDFQHYIFQNRYYCSLMTELLLYVKNRDINLIKYISHKLSKFFDNIYVDEAQDFREHDFDFLITLAKNVSSLTMVGDYYQHSVSGQNNSGKPFKNRTNNISYNEYLEILNQFGFIIDTNSLCSSRRCPDEICLFITKKLGINIAANNEHLGHVIFVDKENAKNILDDKNIIKLILQESEKYSFNAINWGYSKGDTYNNACVILTDTFENIDHEDFKLKEYSTTVNKLYVALSRTRGNLYIIKKSVFDFVKKQYFN